MSAVSETVYLITDRKSVAGRSLESVLKSALEGGVRMIQLREKDLTDGELEALAVSVRELCDAFEAKLIVNGNFAVARQAKADGVHVPFSAVSEIAKYKAEAGRDFLVGVSTHAVEEAVQAEKNGADFVTCGPVYETPSKIKYGAPLGPEKVGAASRACRIPVFGLGGVTPEKIPEMRRYGIARAAMIGAVLKAKDPRAAAVNFRKALA